MKKSLIVIASMLLTAVAAQAQSYNIHKTDGTVINFPAEEVDYLDFTEATGDNAPEGAEAIDLGLPSGLKWANMNVGALSPEQFGLYFAWGETKAYTVSEDETNPWAPYTWCEGSDTTMTKYCTEPGYGNIDNKTVLDPEDDAAVANWGGNWRMPTQEEVKELLDNCDSQWETLNGIEGRRFTSKINGNSIFFPAAGYLRLQDKLSKGKVGYYWSSTLYVSQEEGEWRQYDNQSDAAVYLGFGTGGGTSHNMFRYYGLQVRPVCK